MSLFVEHKKPGFNGGDDGVYWSNGKARVPKMQAQALVKAGHWCDALGASRPPARTKGMGLLKKDK